MDSARNVRDGHVPWMYVLTLTFSAQWIEY